MRCYSIVCFVLIHRQTGIFTCERYDHNTTAVKARRTYMGFHQSTGRLNPDYLHMAST